MITHPADSRELQEALHLLFIQASPQERSAKTRALLDQFEAGQLASEGVFMFRESADSRLLGVLVANRWPDGNLLLWPAVTAVEPKDSEPILRALYEAFDRWFAATWAKGAVMMVDQFQSADPLFLHTFGFEYVSQLLYLIASEPPFSPSPTARLVFRPMPPDDLPRMTALVERTYRNTLDFPRLIGISSTTEILDGYMKNNLFRPELWFYVHEQSVGECGDPVGVLLLSSIPEHGEMELTYMGLLEEVRGRGHAAEIVAFAQTVTRREGASMLLTSVDQQNAPALRGYLRAGFRVFDRKSLFFKPHPSMPAPSR